MDDDEASDAIDAAMSCAKRADHYIAKYHERD